MPAESACEQTRSLGGPSPERTQRERPHSNVAQESVVVAVVDDLAPNGW